MGYLYLNDLKRNICKCERCGHVWLPRQPQKKPIACAKCKSAYWSIPMPSNIDDNKDKNTIAIDLDKNFVKSFTENIIKKNKEGFIKLANL